MIEDINIVTSDDQGLQNNFNRQYLYNSKMVVKFLTKLSLDALKKKSTLYEIFRFFRLFWRPCSSEKLPIFGVILVFISG
jgi:hypothetical protein